MKKWTAMQKAALSALHRAPIEAYVEERIAELRALGAESHILERMEAARTAAQECEATMRACALALVYQIDPEWDLGGESP